MACTILASCGQTTQNSRLAIPSVTVTSSYQEVKYNGSANIEVGDYSFATVNIAARSDSSPVFYTLTAYDANENVSHCYREVQVHTTGGEEDNVSCKVVPGGHITLEVKSDSLAETTVDFSILLE